VSPVAEEAVLAEASFNRSVRSYWLLNGTIILTVTVFGIVLLPIWWLVGFALTERYLRRMRCVLTERSLKLSKGVLVRQEKTVPLDKITDLALIEGPVMRLLDLQALKVETAGTSTPGSFITMVGIVDARAFRDTVLDQRDRVSVSGSAPMRSLPSNGDLEGTGSPEVLSALQEIRDVLVRIEDRLPRAD
jgi:putative membrane protein